MEYIEKSQRPENVIAQWSQSIAFVEIYYQTFSQTHHFQASYLEFLLFYLFQFDYCVKFKILFEI